jgi:sterol 14-demethylase
LVGPEAQETFFKAGDDVLSQDEVYGFTKPVFGANVVYDAGRRERTVQFQTMANGLRTSRMKTYVEKIEREARQYFKEFWNKPAGEVDLLEAFSEMTILTASRCLHGDDVRENLFKEVQKLYHDLDAGVTPLSVFWSTAPTKRHRARDEARREMVRLFTKVIQKRREEPEKYKDSEDILSLFMDIKYKDGTRISEDEVTGLLIALLFAGQHTSCITSTWTALWIANNPAILERVMQEQKEIAKDGQSLNFDIVNQMEYLHNCMRETLRMCPTFIMLIRLAMTDIPVKIAKTTYTIPKGDYVIVSPTLSMRLETVFPNPNTYDPDRYAPPREEHKIPYAYMGFGAGMHSCMGQNFAYLQVKTILSVLFREYEIERVAQEMPKVGYNDMVVGPSGDCRIRYKKRNV